MDTLFPTGWGHFLAGGLILGAGVALIFLCTGIRAGASGVFTTVYAYFSRRACFRSARAMAERHWRAVFSVGLVVGALLYTVTTDKMVAHGWDMESPRHTAFGGHATFVTHVQPWRLLLGGVLVGFGTRLSRGCTSGHGICGLSAGSRSSLAAVITFMGVAIAVAHLVEALGVRP